MEGTATAPSLRNFLNRHNETHAFREILIRLQGLGIWNSVGLYLAFVFEGQFLTDYLREGNQLRIKEPIRKLNFEIIVSLIFSLKKDKLLIKYRK
jgi:hypothetical protein